MESFARLRSGPPFSPRETTSRGLEVRLQVAPRGRPPLDGCALCRGIDGRARWQRPSCGHRFREGLTFAKRNENICLVQYSVQNSFDNFGETEVSNQVCERNSAGMKNHSCMVTSVAVLEDATAAPANIEVQPGGKQAQWLRDVFRYLIKDVFRDLKVAVPVADTTDTRNDLVAVPPPRNATCLEKCRDHTLAFFCRPLVASIFIFFAQFVFVLIGCWGVVIVWSIFGLYFNRDNGGTQMSLECLELAASYNQTLRPQDVPRPPGARWGWSRDSPVDYCNESQRLFNLSIKWFTGCFSYINFLPIPWRLAIFHHVWLSHRSKETGLDFYGRRTETLWFQLPVRDRRVISVLLNLAYILHYVSQTTHVIYHTYVEGQTWPGAFAQNAPFITSIVCAVAAGKVQEKAEDKVMAANPKVYPPRLGTFLKKAWGKWTDPKGLTQGGLTGALRHELNEYKKSCEAAYALGNATARAPTDRHGIATRLTGVAPRAIDGTSRVEPAALKLSIPPPTPPASNHKTSPHSQTQSSLDA